MHRDGVAASYRDLLRIIPLERIAGGDDIGCRGHLQPFAPDDANPLIHIVIGVVADDGAVVTGDRDIPVSLDAIDLRVILGIAGIRGIGGGARLYLTVMGNQRVRLDRSGAARRDSIAAGDVELFVLLPLDTIIGLDVDRKAAVRGAELGVSRAG